MGHTDKLSTDDINDSDLERCRKHHQGCTKPLTFVPGLPVLPPPPNVGDSQDSAQMADEDESGDAVAWRDGDIKASIAVEETGVGTIEFNALLVDDKHGDLSPILGGIEDLANANQGEDFTGTSPHMPTECCK